MSHQMRIAVASLLLGLVVALHGCNQLSCGRYADAFTEVEGVVSSENGDPIQGAQITLEGQGLYVSPARVSSDSSGRFRYSSTSRRGPRPLRVTTARDGYTTSEMQLESNHRHQVRIVLRRK